MHYNRSIKECHIERITFTSITLKVVIIKGDITLQRMKEVIIRKIYRKAKERLVTIHFRYPIRLGE